MFRLELDLLRGALLFLVLSLALGVMMVMGAQIYLQETEGEYQRQRAKLDGVARLFRTAENDRSLYSQYVERYEALERKGVIGNEPRLNWVEALQQVNEDLKLPVLRYDIEPQQQVNLQKSRYDSKIIQVYRSTMALEAGLLHEVDLVTLLSELRRLTNGRFEVRNCDVSLVSAARGISFNVRTPNLLALCTIDWYTLKIEETAGRNEQAS